MKLDPEDHAAIAAQVVQLLKTEPAFAPPAPLAAAPARDVLTRDEARQFTARLSEGAFSEWCKRWGVRAAIRGRYSKQRLELALEREARETGRKVA